MSIALTPTLLAEATGCTPMRAELFAAPLAEACAAYGINASPERLAAFLAQIGHESASLRYVAEVWGPTAAQARYEGRADLGNTRVGDGYLYRGRGLIQTTGRANYAALRERLRERLDAAEVPDFEADPEQLEHIRWAVWSAADYWGWRNLSVLADAGDFERITRRINGGLNGHADRLQRWDRARAALHINTPAVIKPGLSTAPTPEVTTMPLPAILGALLPTLIESVPKLGKLFGSGSEVAERNIKAAELAMQIAKDAIGARNDQEAVEMVKADPAAAAKAAEAIEARWLELTEAGGDGIAGARKADAERSAKGDLLHSPSFWVTLALLPLVYMVVGSIVGLWGNEWPSDVRAAIATAVVSLIVGGAAGYYWGQTTSRNRTPTA